MQPRFRVGLTGGIASGKSTAAKRFAELSIVVIDADESARRVVAPGQPGLDAVIREFGPTVVTADGFLDRRALRKQVFADADRRRQLEAILHPLIRSDMEALAQHALSAYVVMAIPLLVEGDYRHRGLDRILVIDIPEGLQETRVMKRDGVTADQARAIIGAQATREVRLRAANDVLVNVGSVSELRQGVDRLHRQYLHMADSRGPDRRT